MKQYSIFKKIAGGVLLISTALFFLFTSSVHAESIVVISKKFQQDSVTITVGAVDGPAADYKDIDVYLDPGDGSTFLGSMTKGNFKPDGTYTEKISGLKKGKGYSIMVQYTFNGNLRFIQMGAFTAGEASTPTLPLAFDKGKTSIDNGVLKVAIINNSTKSFDFSIFVKDHATGSVVDSKTNYRIDSKGVVNLVLYSGIKTGNTYDLSLSGIEVSAPSTTYDVVTYAGLLAKASTTTTGQQDNQETTEQYDPKATTTGTEKIVEGDGTCKDGKDNSVPSDGKADYYGVDTNGDGKLDLEPDPSCIAPEGTEKADISNSRLISCYNYCTFTDVLKTINNLITFLITTLFIPIVILLFMYAGFKYITAQGDPKKIVDLKKLVMNILIGMLLVLCSWLIVKVILTVLVKDEDSALQFLE